MVGYTWLSHGRLQSMENQVCPKSKTRVPVAPELVMIPDKGLRWLPHKKPSELHFLGNGNINELNACTRYNSCLATAKSLHYVTPLNYAIFAKWHNVAFIRMIRIDSANHSHFPLGQNHSIDHIAVLADSNEWMTRVAAFLNLWWGNSWDSGKSGYSKWRKSDIQRD